MAIEALIAIIGFIVGISILIYSSDKAVEHSIKIATLLGVSPFIVGLILVSIGTDLPEIANSVISSAAGYGDINVGDSLGSVLTQITLILGLLALLTKDFLIKRREILAAGFFLVLSLLIVLSIVREGYVSRLSAFILIVGWLFFMFFTEKFTKKEVKKEFVYHYKANLKKDLLISIISFIGVAIGSIILIQSIITLSSIFNISEYIISFFLVAIGTSLPELVVDITAIRRKEFELVIGDIIGSCIVDATVSIGIGNFLFPSFISANLALITGLYALLASIFVITTLAIRKKLDREAGLFFIFIYLFSFAILSLV